MNIIPNDTSTYTKNELFLKRNESNISQLGSLHNQNFFDVFIAKINSIINKIFYDNSENQHLINSALRTEEQLFSKKGSKVEEQKETFVNFLSSKKGPHYEKLQKEMKGIWKSPLNDQNWFDYEISSIKGLKVGESRWVNLGTDSHAMFMRVTKEFKDGEIVYKIQHVNTGAGLENNHKKIVLPNNKVLYQTVLEFPPIKEKNLPDLLLDLEIAIAAKDINEMDGEKKGEHGEHLAPINAVYDAYAKHLKKPVEIPYEEGSPNYSKPQLGGSCVPSAMWALAKVILPSQEFHELRQDMRLDAMVKNYKLIKNGWDNTSTAKILVLETLQRIQGSLRKSKTQIPETFKKMEKELLHTLNMKHVEMKKARRSEFSHDIRQYDDFKKNPSFLSIVPDVITLQSDEHSLKYSLNFKPRTDFVKYEVARDEDNSSRLKGKDQCDNLYLLYFNIANGNDEAIHNYLSKIDLEALTKENPSKGLQTAGLLSKLGSEIFKIEGTRSGIAKAYYLLNLANFMYSNFNQKVKLYVSTIDRSLENSDKLIENLNKLTESVDKSIENLDKVIKDVDRRFNNLNVDFYLVDNRWLNALLKLKIWEAAHP